MTGFSLCDTVSVVRKIYPWGTSGWFYPLENAVEKQKC
jgi:hypothetical protein